MEPHAVAGTPELSKGLKWTGRAVVAAIVVIGGLLTIQTAVNTPNFWETIDRQNAAEIELEDRAFCGRFEIQPGTQAFGSCALELAHIRRAQTERLNRYKF